LSGTRRQLGPPETGDYSWFQTNTITISTNATTDLGTQYAWLYGMEITISGTVTTNTGTPVAGRYIRAQTEPCVPPDEVNPPNFCGPVKLVSAQTTDAQGNYVLNIRLPGTYYFYESQCLGDQHRQYIGNPKCVGRMSGPVTVQAGDAKNINFVIYPPHYY
jgi:hypothetical protein